ncbi:MAG TPA: hypothetical protein VJI66_00620 [Candidatus Paceibacterota bacterium]
MAHEVPTTQTAYSTQDPSQPSIIFTYTPHPDPGVRERISELLHLLTDPQTRPDNMDDLSLDLARQSSRILMRSP